MYLVLGYSTMDIDSGCDAEVEVDTLKEAKTTAHNWFTDFEQPLERILVKNSKGECVIDKY